MSRRYWAITPLVALAAVTAQAGTISKGYTYDIDFQETSIMTLNGFDDQGGTLQLDRVLFDWDLHFDVAYRLENTGPTAVNAGDFAMSLEYYTVHQLGVGEGHPAYGPGGTYFSIEDVALPAYDGTPGGEDLVLGTASDSYQRTLEFTAAEDPTFLAAMSHAGPVDTVYGGFGGIGFSWINEPVGWDPPSGPFGQPVYPTDDAIWFSFDSARHSGTVTVTYEYSAVPEPAMASLLGVLALACVRRRRA